MEHRLFVGTTPGVQLRGPERSEGHVSWNGRVRPHSATLELVAPVDRDITQAAMIPRASRNLRIVGQAEGQLL